MATLITPTTELEAVNECLANIGQSPVSTLSGDIGVDAELALQLVRKVNRELQVKGWSWNVEFNYELTPNSDGDIILPANTLSVDVNEDNPTVDIVSRGRRLYNRGEHTYTFADKVKATITFGLSFEDIPETARRYVALRAARIFQERTEGMSTDSDQLMEQEAMSALVSDNLRIEDNNLFTDNLSTMEILRRRVY